jgi:hypothetical protein
MSSSAPELKIIGILRGTKDDLYPPSGCWRVENFEPASSFPLSYSPLPPLVRSRIPPPSATPRRYSVIPTIRRSPADAAAATDKAAVAAEIDRIGRRNGECISGRFASIWLSSSVLFRC